MEPASSFQKWCVRNTWKSGTSPICCWRTWTWLVSVSALNMNLGWVRLKCLKLTWWQEFYNDKRAASFKEIVNWKSKRNRYILYGNSQYHWRLPWYQLSAILFHHAVVLQHPEKMISLFSIKIYDDGLGGSRKKKMRKKRNRAIKKWKITKEERKKWREGKRGWGEEWKRGWKENKEEMEKEDK